MADFEKAYLTIAEHEGGYVNDPDDSGGETFAGISRVKWPNWDGWTIVDSKKKISGFPGLLLRDNELQKKVKQFYRFQFWNMLNASGIEDQNVATMIFDFAVNAGLKTCVKIVQNILDVEQDGIMGIKTLSHLNTHDSELFETFFKLERTKYYLEIAKRNPVKIKYLPSWLNRTLY